MSWRSICLVDGATAAGFGSMARVASKAIRQYMNLNQYQVDLGILIKFAGKIALGQRWIGQSLEYSCHIHRRQLSVAVPLEGSFALGRAFVGFWCSGVLGAHDWLPVSGDTYKPEKHC